jgi:hypothetical protein
VKIITIALLILTSLTSFAESGYSMRRCTLLPISDGINGALGLKVFESIEKYLLENTWCQYQSNSDLLGVFSRYRENLYQHLRTPEVVRTVADKLQAGSIVRVNLKKEIGNLEVSLEVIGGNGEDILFFEKRLLEKDDLDIAFSTVRNWLEIYGRTIPYDGRVMGVLGDQITIDIGRGYQMKMGQDLTIKRLNNIKKHPLFKKVVEWDVTTLASGKVFSISDNQALGIIKVYKTNAKIQNGDWVKLEAVKEDNALDDIKYAETKDSFGKLGIASLYLTLGTSSLAVSEQGSRRMNGLLAGFEASMEAWITRNWFGVLEIDRSLGSLSKSSGSFDNSKTSYQRGSFKFGGGYKYLPLGFFYGPQVDFTVSYLTNVYRADFNEADAVGEFSTQGLALGVSTNFPVGRLYRGIIGAEFMPFPGFTDEDGAYGSEKSTSWLQLVFGAKYQYSQTVTLDCLFQMTSMKSSFNGDVKSVSAQDNVLKIGASHNF